MMDKIIPVVFGALCTISISLSGWTLKEVVDLRSKVVSLEVNTIKSDDALQIWKEIATIKQDITKNTEKIGQLPLQGPPAWFIEQVKGMESRLTIKQGQMEDKIDRNYQERQRVIGTIEERVKDIEISIAELKGKARK